MALFDPTKMKKGAFKNLQKNQKANSIFQSNYRRYAKVKQNCFSKKRLKNVHKLFFEKSVFVLTDFIFRIFCQFFLGA